jgi:hypothetical protein
VKKLDEDEMEVLVQVGLIYEVNNVVKFSHQTYGEFGFNRFLDHHFDDEDCSRFIVEEVLVYDSYEIIRSFMNFWIADKITEETCESYRELLLECSIEGLGTPLQLAGFEGNENVFQFLYSALATKGGNFEQKKPDIEKYLMSMSKSYPFTAFAYYLINCDDDLDILSKIKMDFGTEFLKKIFLIKMEHEKSLLHYVSRSDENIVKVLIFLRQNFSDDLEFLKEVLLLVSQYEQTFLYNAFYFLKNESLIKLLDELELLKSILGHDFIVEFILMRSGDYGVFLSRYAWSKHFSNGFFISFLSQLKLLCDQERLKQLFLITNVKSITLYDFCRDAKNFNLLKTICWINQKLGKEFLIEIILLKDKWNDTIFHDYTSSSKQSNSALNFLSILNYLKHDVKLENDFLLDKVLFNFDDYGNYAFSNIFLKAQEKDFYLKFFAFLSEDLNLTDNHLKLYLIKNNLLFLISQIDKSIRNEVLSILYDKFGKAFFSHNFYTTEKLDEIFGADPEKIINYFNFITEQDELEFLRGYVMGTKSNNQSILFKLKSNLTEIFEWFKEKIDNDENVQEILHQVDENGDSFLTYNLKKTAEWDSDYFARTVKFLLTNFDKTSVKKFLLIQNNENKNCFDIISERDGRTVIEIIDILIEDFPDDQDFFKTFITEEMRENCLIINSVNDQNEENDENSELSQDDDDDLNSNKFEDRKLSCCKIC